MAQFIQKIYSKEDNAYYPLGTNAENVVCKIGNNTYNLQAILEDYFNFREKFSILYESSNGNNINNGDSRIILEKVEVIDNTTSTE